VLSSALKARGAEFRLLTFIIKATEFAIDTLAKTAII
jgi:hypothetical protein